MRMFMLRQYSIARRVVKLIEYFIYSVVIGLLMGVYLLTNLAKGFIL